MRKKIVRREYNTNQIDALNASHVVLGRVYAARQITSSDELDHSIEKLLPYQALLGIEKAVEVLSDALIQNKRILIVGDFDADGATSTAVAVRALRSFGAQHVNYLVPNRFAYGYGLTPELVEAAKAYTPDLIMTVDNGIANHAGVDAAVAAGIRVVVTDHHLPSSTLPNAAAIVNPNQMGDVFPSKNLAGVGVIFYVMLALRRHLLTKNWFADKRIAEPNMSRLLDLVALGTVADLVPLDRNNRIIVQHGLRRMRAGQCVPAIVALLELAGRDFTRIVASDLGFAVASRLNAAGRLDDMSLGIECLLTDDPIRAREIARSLDQLNDERRSIESGMQAQAMTVLNKLANDLRDRLPSGLCLFDQGWHQGVIGILAARIKERYNRPTIVFALGQDNEIKGSARSIAGLHIRDVLALIDTQHPGLIKKFGGHAMAAGLTLQRNQFELFAKIYQDIVSTQLTEAELQHSILSDGELGEDNYTLDLATLLRDAGPWGQAFAEPIFDDTFQILEQRIVGDKHLKLRLRKGEKILDAVAFFVDLNEWPNHRCQTVKAAYRLDVNEYKGKRSVQLIVDYLEAI